MMVRESNKPGKYSVTLHSALYLEKKFPEHSFSYINAAQKIKALESDITEAKDKISEADHIFFKSHGQYDFPHREWGKTMAT